MKDKHFLIKANDFLMTSHATSFKQNRLSCHKTLAKILSGQIDGKNKNYSELSKASHTSAYIMTSHHRQPLVVNR